MSEQETYAKTEILKELDKGLDDLKNGRVTPHDEAMKIVRQRIHDYVLQNTGNGRNSK